MIGPLVALLIGIAAVALLLMCCREDCDHDDGDDGARL